MEGFTPMLPVILNKLDSTLGLRKSFDDLYNQIEETTELGKRADLRKEIERAISVGQDLGIVRHTNGKVRLAFPLRKKVNRNLVCPSLRDRCAALDKPNKKKEEEPPEEPPSSSQRTSNRSQSPEEPPEEPYYLQWYT